MCRIFRCILQQKPILIAPKMDILSNVSFDFISKFIQILECKFDTECN